MAEFEIGKNLDEIQEKGALLEEDWYKVRLVKDPKSEPNKVMKSNGPKEKQRKNIVLNLRVVSDDPSINGRPFTKWLPQPNEFDFARMDEYTGTSFGDRMLSTAIKWSIAFGNDCSDGKLHFESGQEAYVYIVQEYDNRVEDPTVDDLRNTIDMNTVPRSVEEMR